MVENWKDAWKWLSIHAATITAVLGALQATLPYFQGMLTPSQFGILMASCGVLTIWARLVKQP
jgi:hypothetical protein